MTTATFEATDGMSVVPFEVVAETVVAIETAESAPAEFEVGDKVRVAANARSVSGYRIYNVTPDEVGTLNRFDTYDGWLVETDTDGYGVSNWIAPQYLTKLTEVDLLREELAKVTTERDAAQESSTAARDLLNRQAAEFEAWKANLQEVALRAAVANEMCGVFDRVMEEVGLEGREREFAFRVELESSIYVSVSATSMTAARDEINEDLIRTKIQDSLYSLSITDWSIDEDD